MEFQALRKITSPSCGFDIEHMNLSMKLAEKLPDTGVTQYKMMAPGLGLNLKSRSKCTSQRNGSIWLKELRDLPMLNACSLGERETQTSLRFLE